MKDAIEGAFLALVMVAAIILMVILGTLFGGIAGWIVGLFFTDTIMTTLDAFGIRTFELSMWQLGATLGFIGGFFKSTVRTNK